MRALHPERSQPAGSAVLTHLLPSGWIRSFASSAPSRATGWADDYSRQSAWVLHRNDPPTLREIAKSTYFDGDAVAGDAVTDVPECGVGDIDVRSDGQTVGAQVDAVGFADLDLLPARRATGRPSTRAAGQATSSPSMVVVPSCGRY